MKIAENTAAANVKKGDVLLFWDCTYDYINGDAVRSDYKLDKEKVVTDIRWSKSRKRVEVSYMHKGGKFDGENGGTSGMVSPTTLLQDMPEDLKIPQ